MGGYSDRIKAILLDIEGTTTPVSFVVEQLFPFARQHLAAFLQSAGQTEAVQADLALLRQEYEMEADAWAAEGAGEESADKSAVKLPEWQGKSPQAALPYLNYLMDQDRKSTALKAIQGKVWDQGYGSGELRSQLFPDVLPAVQRWQADGKKLFIFSSGSVPAQKLLFRHTEAGDLTPYLSGYFDTEVGPKKVAASYRKIAAIIGLPPPDILFISDVAAELQAAESAGMATLFSQRPHNPYPNANGFEPIQTFAGIG